MVGLCVYTCIILEIHPKTYVFGNVFAHLLTLVADSQVRVSIARFLCLQLTSNKKRLTANQACLQSAE